MTSLDDLVRLVPPPSEPVLDPVDWAALEGRLGTRLPADYKALCATYGAGRFDDFLTVHRPVSRFLTVDLAFQARRKDEILEHLRRHEPVPYPRGQLTAVGGTDNGDTVYWVRRPRTDPDAWTITGNGARNTRWPEFPGGLVAFLHAVLSRTVRFPIFPSGFPRGEPAFTPDGPPDPRRVASLRAQGLYRDDVTADLPYVPLFPPGS